MNAHNPAWFVAAEAGEQQSYADWSRQHPLLTAEQEKRWLRQYQDNTRALLMLTQPLGVVWWQQRYPGLDWQRDWLATLWAKRPSFADLRQAVEAYRQLRPGASMVAQLWQRLNQAREVLLGSNVRLVFSVAHQHTRQGLDLTDLVQEGQLGLMRALEKFDVAQGTRFSTYSHYWIQQFIRLALKNQSSLVRKPTNVVDDLKRFQRQLVSVQQRLGQPLSSWRISRELDMPEIQVRRFLELTQAPLSLDRPLTEDSEDSWSDLLEDDSSNTAEAGERLQLAERLRASVVGLDRRQQVIVSMRYGLGHGREYGYREIADQLDLSRERVRQIEKEALQRLRAGWSDAEPA